MIKWLSILAAVAGCAVGVYTVSTAAFAPPNIPLVGEPSVNPYASGIACTGLVEAGSKNIHLGPAESALVTRVMVEVGQTVKAGDALVELDSRQLASDMVRAEAALVVARAGVERLKASPRSETIPPLEAQVRAIEVEVADWQDQYDRLKEAKLGDAASSSEMQRRFFQIENAKARLEVVKANLALAKSGSWNQDISVAEAEVARAQADVEAIRLLMERRTVRSPINGTVLKRNVEPGQYALADGRSATIVVGDLQHLNIRARVDEEDLPMLRNGAAATARVRGRAEITVPLIMLRIEPLAQPKSDLSGSTTERVDTRVLEVLFRVSGPSTPPIMLYPGQLLDVFIEGSESSSTSRTDTHGQPLYQSARKS
jgi:HlyD family secretion protein